MSAPINHGEWLSLIDVSGPFLSIPVLDKVFPQGLDAVDPSTASRVRSAYEEWRETQDDSLHQAWIDFILTEVLGYEARVLKTGQDIPSTLRHTVPEHGVELRPSAVLVEPGDATQARLLIAEWPTTQKDLQQASAVDSWAATPAERMTELCRATGVRLGLVTNGEQWMLVDAPQGETPAYVTWYASLWIEERITLQAVRSLLGVQRFFAVAADETLGQMLVDSVQYQAEVTDQLGAQVRRAVEVLIQALDKADADAGRLLLGGVPESVLYEASITVMMRLVFLFCAEERDLLLLGDPVYDQYYAVSTLRSILREEADQHGIEVLERRQDAWSRLLAAFRGIYGGIDHESLRLPAYGGGLFDPDRFPFLEGRASGTTWREDLASPLPVDNRTVLHLLEALQLLQMRGKGGVVAARKLSFRALDIEQIGHVYESLLDHTAVRADVPTLGLVGKLGQEPEVSLPALEERWMAGEDSLVDFLHDETGKSRSALQKLIARDVESEWGDQLKRECGDSELYERVEPFHALVREDPWGDPIVMCPGDIYVTAGTDRRSSGTHYTPKALTEEIVRYTLEPLAYVGPAEGKPREDWRLKPAVELLGLKICDPAMGSGAFLVQVVRWLSERIVEAWDAEKAEGSHAESREERIMHARRLVAERCVYGVDINPLAVEMGKLSLWLVTLSKGRPFGFLDHALRCGDSLLGIHDLDQIRYFHPNPVEGRKHKLTLFDPGPLIESAIDEAAKLRAELESFEVLDVRDAEQKKVLLAHASEATTALSVIADLVVWAVVSAAGDPFALDTRLRAFEHELVTQANDWEDVALRARGLLGASNTGSLPATASPFHWPLEFPEVWSRGGFDAIVANPPFIGNKYWNSRLGPQALVLARALLGGNPGKIDWVVVFHNRVASLLRAGGFAGLIGSTSIAEGDAVKFSLASPALGRNIYRARRSRDWPGAAKVRVSIVWLANQSFLGEVWLDDRLVCGIGPRLTEVTVGSQLSEPKKLDDEVQAFMGIDNSKGLALVLGQSSPWRAALERDASGFLREYVSGEDIAGSALLDELRCVVDCTSLDSLDADGLPQVLIRFLEEVVHPCRMASALKGYPELIEKWWLFLRPRPEAYARLRRQDACFVMPKVTKYVVALEAPTVWAFTNKVIVIEKDRPDLGVILNSAFFGLWIEEYSGTLGETLSVNMGAAVSTFSLPGYGVTEGEARYARMQAELRRHHSEMGGGVTAYLNALHIKDSSESNVDIARGLARDADRAVAQAYGWDDLELDHGFFDTKWGPRYTVGPIVREEILDRLLELNHQRHAEELARSPKKDAMKPQRRVFASDAQSLF